MFLHKAAATLRLTQVQPTSLFLGTTPAMGFATKMMGGSTNNKADSAGRRLGIKKWGHSAEIYENQILARQRGFKWHPGFHVRAGKDHTLHAKVEVRRHLSSSLCSIRAL